MNARSISLRSQYELKERFGMKTAFGLRRRSWTFSLNTSWNFESTIASSTIPRTVRPSLSRTAWKYRAYGVARPFSQTTRVGNPSSTAPSHTSRAECEPIVAIRMADGPYDSRTFRIASRPTIVPVPSRCRPHGTSKFNPLGTARDAAPEERLYRPIHFAPPWTHDRSDGGGGASEMTGSSSFGP